MMDFSGMTILPALRVTTSTGMTNNNRKTKYTVVTSYTGTRSTLGPHTLVEGSPPSVGTPAATAYLFWVFVTVFCRHCESLEKVRAETHPKRVKDLFF